MFTPRPREIERTSSPSGQDVDYEKLPPSAIPDRLDPTKRMELEADSLGSAAGPGMGVVGLLLPSDRPGLHAEAIL